MGEETRGRWRVEAAPSVPVAITLVVVGTVLDSLSTMVGHATVEGVEEWNVVILTVGEGVPFALAVFLLKAIALATVCLVAVLWSRKGGSWRLCLVVPGVVWTAVGVVNVVTIVASL